MLIINVFTYIHIINLKKIIIVLYIENFSNKDKKFYFDAFGNFNDPSFISAY